MEFNDIAASIDPSAACSEEINSAVDSLCKLFETQHTELEQKDSLIEQKDHHIDELEKSLRWFREQYALKKAQMYAASSEKNPDQGELLNEAETTADGIDDDEGVELDTDNSDAPSPRKRRQKPSELNPDLPRERIEWPLSDEQRAAAVDTFFEKLKEELHVIPAQFFVREYFQEKGVYLDDHGERTVLNALRPTHPLGKCSASTALLAHVMVNKYNDSMPLYRMNKVLKRHGACVSDASLANWMVRLGHVLSPLCKLIHYHLMQGPLLQIDETPILVIDADSDKSWMWVIRGGPPDRPGVLFDFDLSRSSAVVDRLIDDFEGDYIQCDGYAAYAKPCAKRNLTRVGCFDHARRKFKDAQKIEPKVKKTKPSRADIALALIGKLYSIERDIKELDKETRHSVRQEQSVPQLNKLHEWLTKNQCKVVKDSLIGKAINYTLGQWGSLSAYTQAPYLPISNILVENAIRPFALGRKNWLFSKSENGANASAVHFSMIENAKLNDIEPQAYITHVLEHIADATTEEQLEALLPWNAATVIGKSSQN